MQASAGLVAGGIDKAVTTLHNLKGLGIALKDRRPDYCGPMGLSHLENLGVTNLKASHPLIEYIHVNKPFDPGQPQRR